MSSVKVVNLDDGLVARGPASSAIHFTVRRSLPLFCSKTGEKRRKEKKKKKGHEQRMELGSLGASGRKGSGWLGRER